MSRVTSTTRLPTSWVVRWAIRSRSYTRRAPAFASFCKRKPAIWQGRNARAQRLKEATRIELQYSHFGVLQRTRCVALLCKEFSARNGPEAFLRGVKCHAV